MKNVLKNNYQTFFDYQNTTHRIRKIIENDFVINLRNHLEEINHPSPLSAAYATFILMSDYKRHYHSPVHVLNMLQYAQENNLNLTTNQQFAIWFHDAMMFTGQDEYLSFIYSKSILGNNNLKPLIMATANHWGKVTEEAKIIVDLDLMLLGAKPDLFKTINDEILPKEFKYFPGFTPQKRVDFFKSIPEKVFQTVEFNNKFNQQARENINNAIKE